MVESEPVSKHGLKPFALCQFCSRAQDGDAKLGVKQPTLDQLTRIWLNIKSVETVRIQGFFCSDYLLLFNKNADVPKLIFVSKVDENTYGNKLKPKVCNKQYIFERDCLDFLIDSELKT